MNDRFTLSTWSNYRLERYRKTSNNAGWFEANTTIAAQLSVLQTPKKIVYFFSLPIKGRVTYGQKKLYINKESSVVEDEVEKVLNSNLKSWINSNYDLVQFEAEADSWRLIKFVYYDLIGNGNTWGFYLSEIWKVIVRMKPFSRRGHEKESPFSKIMQKHDWKLQNCYTGLKWVIEPRNCLLNEKDNISEPSHVSVTAQNAPDSKFSVDNIPPENRKYPQNFCISLNKLPELEILNAHTWFSLKYLYEYEHSVVQYFLLRLFIYFFFELDFLSYIIYGRRLPLGPIAIPTSLGLTEPSLKKPCRFMSNKYIMF